VRKRNARGDRCHPHSSQIDENPAERAAGRTAQSRSSVQTVRGMIAETMPDPMPKPPGRPPGEPIIIKDPFRPPEAPEIDGSLDEEEPEIDGSLDEEEEEENPEIRPPFNLEPLSVRGPPRTNRAHAPSRWAARS
jgi:hypothetical protein